ncbi:hypothetical protein PENTCL1PPCAC_10484, partial [Pristionchus entomophagus]
LALPSMADRGTGTRSSKSIVVDRSSEKMRLLLAQQQKSAPRSHPKSEPLSGGMVFGDGKHRAKAYEQFCLLAGDDDVIPVGELNQKLKKQRTTLEMSPAQIEEFIKKADKNGDAMIDFREFESLMASPLAQSNRMQRAMRMLADGVIAKNQKLEVHSYLDAYNCFPPPIFILIASIFQILVFFGYYWSEEDSHDIMTHCAGCFLTNTTSTRRERIPGPLMFIPRLRHEVWRFWTYQFLHAGISHLAGNIIMQCLIGVPLEIVHKVWRIGPLYTMAVLSGALLQYLLDPKVSLVGASGGVYALITAHLANVFLNWNEMPFRWVRIGIVGFYLCFDIGMVVYRRVFIGECDSVSHAAHIAGGITGFCFGIFILHNMVKHKWEEIVRWICVVAYAIFFVGMVVLTIVQEHTAKAAWETSCSNK